MKRIVIALTAGLVFSLLVPHSALAFGVKDVVAMTRDGIPDSLIIEKIHYSGVTFRLDATDFHTLKEAGVSNDVVAVMLRTEGRSAPPVYYDGYPWWPYYPPWYAGFDLGFYVPHYRVYAPLHVRHGFYGRGLTRWHGGRR